jgi:hypothetical protein
MPERQEHTETLRAGTPLTVGAVTLLPIERVVMHSDKGASGLWFAVAKEPYALVVRDPGGLRGFDANAAQVSLERLCEKISGLEVLLASMRSSTGDAGSGTGNDKSREL